MSFAAQLEAVVTLIREILRLYNCLKNTTVGAVEINSAYNLCEQQGQKGLYTDQVYASTYHGYYRVDPIGEGQIDTRMLRSFPVQK